MKSIVPRTFDAVLKKAKKLFVLIYLIFSISNCFQSVQPNYLWSTAAQTLNLWEESQHTVPAQAPPEFWNPLAGGLLVFSSIWNKTREPCVLQYLFRPIFETVLRQTPNLLYVEEEVPSLMPLN
jgi:hypothetical protein